jgi:hypothetical protein
MASQQARDIWYRIFGWYPEDADEVVREAASLALDEWRRLAQNRLRTSADAYANSLELVNVGPGHWSVVLQGKLANLQERGAPAWDLRTTVLTSPKAKTSKAGHKYLSIPFRHQTPGSGGSYGSTMPPDIYASARKLADTLSGADARAAIEKLRKTDPNLAAHYEQRLNRSTRATIWGGLPEAQPGRVRGRLPEGLAPKAKEHHVTDIYAGMYRMGKTYKGATQSQYMTFRTISTNPASRRAADGSMAGGKPTANWIHPGFAALQLAQSVERYVAEHAIPVAIANFRARAAGVA